MSDGDDDIEELDDSELPKQSSSEAPAIQYNKDGSIRKKIGRKRLSPQQVIWLEQQAISMRLAGMNNWEIAASLKIPEAWRDEGDTAPALAYANSRSVDRAIKRGILRVTEPIATELRDQEVARIYEMMRIIWPKVLRGDLPAIDRAMALQKQLGAIVPDFLAPEKHEHSGTNGESIVVELFVPPKGSDTPYPYDNDSNVIEGTISPIEKHTG